MDYEKQDDCFVATDITSSKMKWNKFTLREATKEEQETLFTDYIWNEPLPDIDEEVLVSDGASVWIDMWGSPDEGYCLENSYTTEGLYWAHLPELPT